MSDTKHSSSSEKKNISIDGDVRNSNVFIGGDHLFHPAIIQKLLNNINHCLDLMIQSAKHLNLDDKDYRIILIGSLANQGNQANQVNQG
ncbi:MAG: hypothetical protein U0Z26_15390 [Anaerolineales bacterium]